MRGTADLLAYAGAGARRGVERSGHQRRPHVPRLPILIYRRHHPSLSETGSLAVR